MSRLIASARMYSVTPPVAALWRRLLEGVAERAGVDVEVLDWPVPLPLADLWARLDKAAVFMCGLPYSLSSPRPELVAAPVPAIRRCGGKPLYWSELVVRADSDIKDLADSFDRRIAFTVPDSQSGFVAALRHLVESARSAPLYREVIAPTITPFGAATAVAEGSADIASIDSFAFALMQKHAPELTGKLRVIASTEPMPIPVLVASPGNGELLADAFLGAGDDSDLRPVLDSLLIERFVAPVADAYDVLQRDRDSTLEFWRQRPLAESTDPAFALEP